MAFKLGWYGDPIFGEDGDYPQIMRDIVYEKSMAQGLNESRLPTFTDAEKELNKSKYFSQELKPASCSLFQFSVNHPRSNLLYPTLCVWGYIEMMMKPQRKLPKYTIPSL